MPLTSLALTPATTQTCHIKNQMARQRHTQSGVEMLFKIEPNPVDIRGLQPRVALQDSRYLEQPPRDRPSSERSFAGRWSGPDAQPPLRGASGTGHAEPQPVDRLSPARGLVIGLAVGAVLWAGIFVLAWKLFR